VGRRPCSVRAAAHRAPRVVREPNGRAPPNAPHRRRGPVCSARPRKAPRTDGPMPARPTRHPCASARTGT
jgi:hypothetical protein